MSTKVKTNAMRVLERAGIPFQIREYELDEEHFSAERVAALEATGAGHKRLL